MAENYKNSNGDKGIAAPIPGMEGEIFGMILEFIYCVRIPDTKDEDTTTTKLLLAAGRLGCTDLKLYMESTVVDKFLEA